MVGKTQTGAVELPFLHEKKQEYRGIRVYPVRYGIHCEKSDPHKSANKKYTYEQYGKEIHREIEGHPYIRDYAYYPMPLRKGWLYVYSEIAQGVYEFDHHYTIMSTFSKISYYSKKTDKPDWVIEPGKGFLSVSEDDKIALFFSEVRLTAKVICDVFVNGDKRDMMHELDCKKYSANFIPTPQTRAIGAKTFSIRYPQHGPEEYNESFMTQFNNNVIKQAYTNNKDKSENLDVFFIVDDPVGVANQLEFYLKDKHLDHEAFVRSIRTGGSFTDIKNTILTYDPQKGNGMVPDSEVQKDKANLEHYSAMHNLGVLLYHLLYLNYDKNSKNKSYIKKARNSTSETMVKNVLAVDKRAKLRQQIEEYRKDLSRFLEGKTYQNYCGFFNQLSPPAGKVQYKMPDQTYDKMLLEVKTLIANAYSTLSVLPHIKDQYIDGEKKNYTDPCATVFDLAFDEKSESGKLLYKEMNMLELGADFKAGQCTSDNIEAMFVLTNTLLVTFWRSIFVDTSSTKINIKMLKNNTNNGLFLVDQQELKNILAKMHKEIANEAHVQKASLGRYRFLHVDKYNIEKNTFTVQTRSIISDKAKNGVYWQNKSAAFIKYITQHNAYFGIMSVFYMRSLVALFEEKNAHGALYSSGQLITGVGALRAMFLEKLAERELGITTKVRIDKLERFDKSFKLFIRIGYAVEIFNSVINVINKIKENDKDAMLFHALAGFSSVVGFVGAFKGGIIWGWIGIAAAIVTVAAVLLAEHYSDTEMEKFIKRTIFSNDCTFSLKEAPIDLFSFNLLLLGSAPALEMAKEKTHLRYYPFQLEEFLMCQLLTPSIGLNVSYETSQQLYAFNTIIKTEGVLFTFSINLYYYNERINEIAISPYLLKGKKSGSGTPLYSEEVQQLPAFYRETEIKDNAFHYRFFIKNGSSSWQPFVMSSKFYVFASIRFFGSNNQCLPYTRGSDSPSLMLRYQVEIEEKRNPKGNKYKDYAHPVIRLDKIKIATSYNDFIEKRKTI